MTSKIASLQYPFLHLPQSPMLAVSSEKDDLEVIARTGLFFIQYLLSEKSHYFCCMNFTYLGGFGLGWVELTFYFPE